VEIIIKKNMTIFEHFKNAIAQNDKPVVYEFGACDGYHTNELLNILRATGKPFVYHAFEPVESLIPTIESACKNHIGLFSLHQCAVGAKNESGKKLYKSNGQYYGSSSIRKPKKVFDFWKDMTFEEHTCEVTTFDTHITAVGLSDIVIDFVWSDIQGAEIDLIKGGSEAFKNVRYFFTEFNNHELYEGQLYNQEELLKLLPDFEIVEEYYEIAADGTKNLNDVLLKNKNL
jgi:FkbM family methyltransferase